MAYYNKIGLLLLNQDQTRFLVCEKAPENVTSDYIMPGGKLEESDDVKCLKNEIREELNCEVDTDSLKLIGEYTDVAAGRPDREVSIRLYWGEIVGKPMPSTEVRCTHWIGEKDQNNSRVSPIVRHKIIPNLVEKGILL